MTKHDLYNQPSSVRSLLFSLTKMEHAPRPTTSKKYWHKKRVKALVELALPERQPGDDQTRVNCRR